MPPTPTTSTRPRPRPSCPTSDALRDAARGCTGCELWEPATQTVFAPGRRTRGWCSWASNPVTSRTEGRAVRRAGREAARPGAGRGRHRPGRDLRDERGQALRFTQSGKRRLHQTPGPSTSPPAGRGWTRSCAGQPGTGHLPGRHRGQGDVRAVVPDHQAARGTVLEWEGVALVPTVHPSAILRLDPDDRDAAFDALVADLAVAATRHP